MNHLWLLFLSNALDGSVILQLKTYLDFRSLLFSTENSSANNKNTFKQSTRVLYILCY